MTVEHLWVASLLDIKAVALVCNECKARTTMPMSEDIVLRTNCPLCGHTWYVPPTTVRRGTPSPFRDFVNVLNELRIPENHKEVGFCLFLEFDAPC